MIPEPEGSMNAYMESLTMLLERKDKFFYPTHGPRIPNPIDFTGFNQPQNKQRKPNS